MPELKAEKDGVEFSSSSDISKESNYGRVVRLCAILRA
jgi:hypothetical protein